MAVTASEQPDWYAILGVAPTASDAEIGRAFRRLARQLHPDIGREASGDRFSDVAHAYEILGDQGRRAEYDRRRRGATAGGIRIPVRRWAAAPGEGPEVDRTQEDPDAASEVDLSISVAESYAGTVATVSLPGAVVCAACAGSGRWSPGVCPACSGEGRFRHFSGSIAITRICDACEGSGALPREQCRDCAGLGWVRRDRALTVRVPAGVRDGAKLRLRSSSGAPAGFARVRLMQDEWLSRQGQDLVVRLPLGLAEAALGTTVDVPLPDGRLVPVEVPAGTGPGRHLRVAGYGFAGEAAGDLVLVADLNPRAPSSPEERRALEQLAAVSPDPRSGWLVAAEGSGTTHGSSAQTG